MGLFNRKPREPAVTPCPCGQGDADVDHYSTHIVNVTTTKGQPALTYDCPVCGIIGPELWSKDEDGMAGAPAGLWLHMTTVHGIRN